MKHLALIFWVSLLLVGTVGYGSWLAWREFGGSTVPAADRVAQNVKETPISERGNLPPDGIPVPNFTLTERSGREFQSRDLLGKVWVASYFYASCPGTCKQLNLTLASLQTEPDVRDVQFVSITCDPKNDTPEELQKYAAGFEADRDRWRFLTGDLDQILKLGQERFMLPTAQQSHSNVAVVLDRRSVVRGLFSLVDQTDVSALHRRLLQLLAEPLPKNQPAPKVTEPKNSTSPAAADSKPAAVKPHAPLPDDIPVPLTK